MLFLSISDRSVALRMTWVLGVRLVFVVLFGHVCGQGVTSGNDPGVMYDGPRGYPQGVVESGELMQALL